MRSCLTWSVSMQCVMITDADIEIMDGFYFSFLKLSTPCCMSKHHNHYLSMHRTGVGLAIASKHICPEEAVGAYPVRT